MTTLNNNNSQMQQMQDKATDNCMAFAKLFDQDVQTFTDIMFLNVDQLEKQLDKEEFQENGSMAAFRCFLEYTRIEVQQFHDTLIQHMESVKKSIEERALHKREYDSRVNERKTDANERGKDTSSRSGKDADVDDANIKPVYDEEPMVEVQLTTNNNVFATGHHLTEW
ncbi:hypothetical protein Tco_0629999 [Tanacetum coccineum]|uniref:FH2 domain-containing protein n=1 Tax=Tanacetum coccineum TaxID=301880 RepID=A0ABQ4WUS2_9ASTR